MKHFLKSIFSAGAFVLLCASCADEGMWSGSSETGRISLNVSADSRVMRLTRADDNVSPIVPGNADFAIELKNSNGSFSKKWNSVELFNKESAFPIGDYILKATYGIDGKEGFENPYYMGEANVHVSPGASNKTEVVATLANAMVSVRYTDEFKENFPAYSAAVQTAGHDWLVFAKNEDRPAYITPSEVKLNLTLTNFNDEQVTIQPAGFTALARHHYVVTIGVNGSGGDLTLNVQFDEDVVAETVSVSLGEELFTAPAPEVRSKGFEMGTTQNTHEYVVSNDMRPQFHVFSFGGMKEVNINVISDNGHTPVFGTTAQLVNASGLIQQQLASEGFECSGFYPVVGKMGVVDVRNFVKNVPVGKYKIQVQAVDAMTRTSEVMQYDFDVLPLELSLESNSTPEFMSNSITVDLISNTPDVKDEVSFQVPDANNRFVDVPVKSVNQLRVKGNTRAGEDYMFRYLLEIPATIRNVVEVKASVGKRVANISVPVAAPEYEVEIDAFSKKALFKIGSANDLLTKSLIDNMKIYIDDRAVPSSSISHDAKNNIITVQGLSSATTYGNVKFAISGYEKEIPAFTTETELPVPNGTFSQLGAKKEFKYLQVGGKYRVGAFDYYNRVIVNYEEPVGWATINEKTCYSNASNKNTWFMVPSTLCQNGSMTIRSVGYNHNGVSPDKSGSFFSTAYYCANSPSYNQLEKVSGELFLGSYKYENSNETRNNGVAFQSRPSSLSFNYTYQGIEQDKGVALVEIQDESGSVIARKQIEVGNTSSNQVAELSLEGYSFGRKPAKLLISFKSSNKSNPSISIPTGSALEEPGVSLNSDYFWTLPENTYNALAIGSVLTISNVQFKY